MKKIHIPMYCQQKVLIKLWEAEFTCGHACIYRKNFTKFRVNIHFVIMKLPDNLLNFLNNLTRKNADG